VKRRPGADPRGEPKRHAADWAPEGISPKERRDMTRSNSLLAGAALCLLMATPFEANAEPASGAPTEAGAQLLAQAEGNGGRRGGGGCPEGSSRSGGGCVQLREAQPERRERREEAQPERRREAQPERRERRQEAQPERREEAQPER